MALIPGRLLGAAPHAQPLVLPATLPVQPVHMALPKPKPRKVRAVVVVRHIAPAVQLAAAPVVVAAPKPVVQHAVAKKPVSHTPLVSPTRIRHPRVPVQPLAPKPAPAAPAPAPTATVSVADPLEQTAAPETTTTQSTHTTTVSVPIPQPPDHGHGHGHGHGHNR